MKSKNYVMSLLFLLFLSSVSSQVHALDGKDVWKEESQIIFEYDYELEWNPSLIDPALGIQNYNLVDQNYKISYIGIYEDDMFFKTDSSSETLSQIIGLSFTQFTEDLIDRETGYIAGTEDWSGYFYDTKDFVIGSEINDIKYSQEYEDINGLNSINKKFYIAQEETIEIKLDSISKKEVKVWKLSVDDFEFVFRWYFFGSLIDYTYKFSNLNYLVSSVNGVMLGFNSEVTILAQTDLFFRESMNGTAIEANNVKIDQSQVGGSPGFEFYISIITFGLIIVFSKIKKKRNY